MKVSLLLLMALLVVGCGSRVKAPTGQEPARLISVEEALQIADQVSTQVAWHVGYEPHFAYEFNLEQRIRKAWMVRSLQPGPNIEVNIDAETGEILRLIQSEAVAMEIDVAITQAMAMEMAHQVNAEAEWRVAFATDIDVEGVGKGAVWMLRAVNAVVYIDADSGAVRLVKQF